MNEASGYNGTGRLEWSWNSSASFLYGGLVPIFGVIGLALLVVACSRRGGSRKQTESLRNPQVNEEPNILVIVAGEEHPTHLAKPLPL
uniref:Uncharacterized protein n=2 Tax=Cajanus cajan TaxID=3821 RepID=A0A151SPH3_CAJCA|nr:hypothetical protein KK1_002987 [Cajanus cajan]